MPANSSAPLKSAIYTPEDHAAVSGQLRRRWLAVSLPCALLLAAVVASLFLRVEAVTTLCTILMGATLIFAYDLFIKPLAIYRGHLNNVLYGRTRETVLPFLSLSGEVTTIGGIACRAMLFSDTDAKGRPTERLFYLDAQKTCPDFQAGEVLRVVHHDLMVADISRA